MKTHYPSPQAAFQDLFRRSTGQSVTIVLLLVFGSYGLWTLGSSLFALVTQTETLPTIWPQSQPQIQSLLNTLLSAGLIATALPWLMLSTHGEWLLTRSLNRWEVFVLLRRLYLQFWVLLTLGLGLLTWWSQHWVSTSGYELSWWALGFNTSLSLYLACMAAGGATLVYRQILPLGALLVWQGIAGFFPALNPISGAISSALWALCVAGVIWQVHRHFATESPQIMTPLEENRDIPPLYQELRWGQKVRPLSPRWARLQLLTRHGQMIYQHLLLGGLVLGFTQILWSSYRQFQPGSYFNGPSLIFDVIYAVLFCAVALVMFSPRTLIHRYREYFLTRPI